jgi:hypothetical protein
VQQLKPGDGMERQHFAEEMLDHIDPDVDFNIQLQLERLV